MYSVGKHTFERHKVLWMDVSATMKAVVVSGFRGNDMPIPEHKLMFVTTQNEDEAHYVAAILNSSPFNTVVTGYIVDNSVSTHPIGNLVIPRLDPKDARHKRLASMSKAAHKAAAKSDEKAVKQAERDIDQTVVGLW
jgi:hypothetical protein